MDLQQRQTAMARLDATPRLAFGCYPTPIEEMPRLRAALGAGCPRLFIKRDDYTGFGFGGNKVRALEYLLAEAVAQGAQVVITMGGERSNHARMTAACCARLGLRCVLVLDRKPRPAGAEAFQPAANFIEKLFGAEVHLVETREERMSLMPALAAQLRAQGVSVFEIPLGGGVLPGPLGFVAAARELAEQIQEAGLQFSHLFFASSSGGTQAGLLLGAQLCDFAATQIIGVSPDDPAEVITEETRRLLREMSALSGAAADELPITVLDEYAGPGYCIGTAESEEAVQFLARTEGIILDPVYTAKAMAALLDWIRQGKLTAHDTVLFWHTGGQLTMFYAP
ncbi:MAG: D-cysteine desulfhydrase family protein [Blastocatellia bacterium]